ncbi:MAG TPA: hypothetical protein VGU44_05550 [Gammaproteobacteria bacterium]|nr:hypothetical protein [Gammaproteobacteria bacterium]
MQIEKKSLAEHGNGILFQDKYGVLQLAANATLARTPRPPKLIRWASRILTFIKQLYKYNSIIPTKFIWMEPMDFMYEIIWQKHMQNEEDE